jgi:hypothetical protein
MKMIGLLSALTVLAYSSSVVHGASALYLAALVFAVAFWLSGRMKAGSSSATLAIALWTIGLLAYDVFIALPPSLRDDRSGDFSSIVYTSIGTVALTLPIYFVTRGVIARYAYQGSLRKKPSEFDRLTQDPWENGRNTTRKHPKFLNTTSRGMYAFLILIPLVYFLVVGARLNQEPIQGTDVAYQIGSFLERVVSALAVWMLLAFLYRRARRHAMLPGSELARKEHRAIVLYLRSFGDDTIKVRARATDGRIFLERFLRISFEELVTDHLWRFGPVVAIGNPQTRDQLAPLGAARDYESDATWQQKAASLMQGAALIVAVLGETPGFLWEIERIVTLGFTSKLLLVLPPPWTQKASPGGGRTWCKEYPA